MSSLFDKLQPAVKKETKNVALSCIIFTVLMWVIFWVLHIFWKEKIPFDYTVILGGILGSGIAVLNFFLMGISVQKIAAMDDEGEAKKRMKASYSQRFMLQVIWVVIAILVPCFNMASGMIPLLFPGLGIKIRGIAGNVKR